MKNFTFKVIVAIKEITVYEYEVNASNEEEAKEKAFSKHFDRNDDNEGKLVDREEWVNEIDCEEEYEDEDEEEAI
jgi:hypothetical protein